MEFLDEQRDVGIFYAELLERYRQPYGEEKRFESIDGGEGIRAVVAGGVDAENAVTELRYLGGFMRGHERHPCGEHHGKSCAVCNSVDG